MIAVPPIEEQKEIVRRVEELFAIADRIEAQYRTARARVDRLTQSLLAKAFKGALVPQDPDDEPAAALLARLRTQRSAAPPPNAAAANRRMGGAMRNPSTHPTNHPMGYAIASPILQTPSRIEAQYRSAVAPRRTPCTI